MAYQVNLIDSIEELEQCELFQINHFNWVEGYQPKAFGRMGLLHNFGLVVGMTAMEAFFNFNPKRKIPYYTNFEMNSNGAMLNEIGIVGDRKNVYKTFPWRGSCKATRKADSWSVLLKVPMEMICNIFSIEPLKTGDSFTCNFYKICESKNLEHYASYAPIVSDRPNFHLPQFFETAVIVERQ